MKPFNLVKDIIAERGSIEEVYWVACGGSLIDLLPAHMLLERESRRIASSAYTAREFCITAPKRLGGAQPRGRVQPQRQHAGGARCVRARP